MMRVLLIILLAALNAQAQPMFKDTVKDNYSGTIIPDPYRWLENDTLARTREWITAENKLTNSYLDAIPFRKALTEHLSSTWNYARETPPVKAGEYYFFTRNNGLQPQNVWFLRKGLNGAEEELLDPNKLSANGTTAVTMLGFSTDNRYLAYAVAYAGSDWNTLHVMDIISRKELNDELKWVKFPRAAWKGNGFYYSRYPAPEKGMELSARNTLNQVYFHRLGTLQEADSLVFEARLSVAAFVTEDQRFLIISSLPGSFLGFKLTSSTGNALHYQDLSVPGSRIQPLIKGYDNHNIVVDNKGGKLLLQTDTDAPNNKVVLLDPAHPEKEHWQTVIPEQRSSLENIDLAGGYMWACYLKDARTLVSQYDYSGRKVRDVQLPGIGTARNFSARKADKDIFYTYTDFTTPETVYRLDVVSGKSVLYRKPDFKGITTGYETRQVFVTSKDGTRLPMFIVCKKGTRLDGNNPVFMQGHGGFKRNLTPAFNVARMIFLERGGIYAQPNLRGGNEYGEAWHRGGMRGNKQNVFDDFIAATEYLIREKYTQPARIAITGVSTGAVMVGACINQRPELFKAAIPVVGAMDMLRYHKFTIGSTWAEEYGTSDNKEQFEYLVKYSPLHNIKAGVRYPATLVLTADHDDTVVPAHSYKYVATLQEKQAGDNPVLIRIDSNAGHGPGKPTTKLIAEAADAWSFIFSQLNVKW
ncbi:prolyl oligopeptidase family serine peptidase [Chitinophaga tropicalis]|uniref:prolyl oligopeptidase n=1 Tax=Chitinophaga tropicalis TaxID=2683588 RepID=A0A7K1U1Q2_9BACT|nr:prolyl oligopeptidase family serine peptidase [Chitinophaga tropicalis]MVT07955.1 prolyl oligopeptidase family serine peptidase [Chitinophaga tropicalis]